MRKLLWLSTTLIAIVVVGAALWIWRFHTYTPLAVVLDIRAALQARNSPRPAERFLELRYGPLTEPANRQKAFLDFFDIDHIEGLSRIVGHMGAAQKQTNIAATAQWIANYRETMSVEEKASLRNYLNSKTGRSTLQKATADYLKRDVTYRSATAPVIKELMATLAAVQNP